jgi:hypothetical protein
VALPLLFKFPITRQSHAAIRAKLDAMDAAATKESSS